MSTYRFNRDALESGLIIGGINRDPHNKLPPLIRGMLNSTTNHTAIIIKHNIRGFGIGDMTPPKASFKTLEEYENLMNIEHYGLRIWRIRDATDEERMDLSIQWQLHVCGMDYTEQVYAVLWLMRLVNDFPFNVRGQWCTRAVGTCFKHVFPNHRNPFRKPNGSLKKNETPKTPENRVIQGILEDVTLRVIGAYT